MSLREAAQQALEALEATCPENPHSLESRAITALRAALAEPEQEFVCSTGLCRYRKPLTDEEIVDLWADVSMDYDDQINIIEMARAIERAHGIGGEA